MGNKGFFGALFDFSFSEFITTKIIKVLYGIGMVLSGIAALVMIVFGFKTSVGTGILFLILSPIAFLIMAILYRVWLEFIIVIFRIAENTGDMAKMTKQ
jgi:uncharacterized membrane protein YedE/YeeE